MFQAKILLKEGMSRTSVADALDVTRRTVYNYEHGRVFDGRRRGRPRGASKLSPFYTYIESQLEKDFSLNAELFFEQLQKHGYSGRISILRDFIHLKRSEMTNYAVLRFETMPGQQAQVDWADAGSCLIDGYIHKRYAFVMKLGYSRRTYVEFTTSMEQSVLFGCMVHAFEYFGGVPFEILFDNMKTAFLFDKDKSCWVVHPQMLLFAQYNGFSPRRCRVRRPKTKGKVEREIRYLRYSFFPSLRGALKEQSNEYLNEAVRAWLDRVDYKKLREFGQTRRERFETDYSHLQSLPMKSFDYRKVVPLVVSKEGLVTHQTNHYSVPPCYRGATIIGRIDTFESTISICQGDTTARVHALQPSGACRTVINTEDRRELLKLWEHGRDTEQRRIEAQRKKQQAQKDNVVNHPAIYDEIFCQELLGVAV